MNVELAAIVSTVIASVIAVAMYIESNSTGRTLVERLWPIVAGVLITVALTFVASYFFGSRNTASKNDEAPAQTKQQAEFAQPSSPTMPAAPAAPPASDPGAATKALNKGKAIRLHTKGLVLGPNLPPTTPLQAPTPPDAIVPAAPATSPAIDEWRAKQTVLEGSANVDRRNYDNAIRLYTEALNSGALNPKIQAVAFCSRGIAYYYKDQFDRAIQDFDQAIELRPDYSGAFFGRGLAYKGKDQYDRAIQDYDQALKLKPDYAFAYGNRAFARKALGQIDLAKVDAKRARELDPKVKVPSF